MRESCKSLTQLVIYSVDGRQLITFTLSNGGMNEVTINAGALSSGQYMYSLLVDGKKVDSKNMILQNNLTFLKAENHQL